MSICLGHRAQRRAEHAATPSGMYHTQWRGTEVYESGEQLAVQLHSAVKVSSSACNDD